MTPKEVQWTMNFALAYVGINHPKFRKRAIDIGEKLGIYRAYPFRRAAHRRLRRRGSTKW